MTQKKRGKARNEDRDLALALGLRTYRGSVHECGKNERYVCNNACVECSRKNALAYYHENKNEAAEFARA